MYVKDRLGRAAGGPPPRGAGACASCYPPPPIVIVISCSGISIIGSYIILALEYIYIILVLEYMTAYTTNWILISSTRLSRINWIHNH